MLDFNAQFTQHDWNEQFNYIFLSKDGEFVAISIEEPWGGSNNMWSSTSLVYRDNVTSDSLFELFHYSNIGGKILALHEQWGYKLYDGSTYPFYN